VDPTNGNIKAAADFLGHKRRVVSLSADSIPSGNTDVVATCDTAGTVLVWTILRAKQPVVGSGYVLSRRPQRP
jgi:hypothetical protein